MPEHPQATLAALQRQITQARGAALMTLHRDAAYMALDLGDSALAMTHAVECLEAARALAEPRLEAKAHVTVALVMADAYDDQGADGHFARAEALARACGDARGWRWWRSTPLTMSWSAGPTQRRRPGCRRCWTPSTPRGCWWWTSRWAPSCNSRFTSTMSRGRRWRCGNPCQPP
ncbi:hypothetical protein [Deinococcus multiflagellatus]|uniref:MalT-like TPR region domain-containing protein n=1 Tax=Deinococcus multiflagellatus TaxID=1656887 RepID=A0ABW1ZU61_9DEIO